MELEAKAIHNDYMSLATSVHRHNRQRLESIARKGEASGTEDLSDDLYRISSTTETSNSGLVCATPCARVL